jgi:DHA2 family multidrug resistance protein
VSLETATPEAAHRGLVTVAVMLATIMQALDTTIANVALPHMQGTMGATQDQISWVLTSYIVAAAIFMPLTGFLSARLGRKRIFMWSVVGFTIASMLCGAAQNLGEIVLFRLLQGVFGASLVPLSQAVLLDAYPRERHGSAMALWGVGVMVGPILGPSLGGWLTEYYNWRWVFYINLPFGILAWLGLAAFVHETPIDRARRFDLLGFALLSIGIGALQMMLDRGESLDWFTNPEVVIEAMAAGLALYLFVAHIFTHDHPFIEPAIFKDRNFSVGLVFIFIIGVILLGTHSHQLFPLADDRVQCGNRGLAYREHRGYPGTRTGVHLRAPVHHYLFHLGTAFSQRGHRTFQPAAQYRQQHWHFRGDHLSGATHANQPRRLFRLHKSLQPWLENGG